MEWISVKEQLPEENHRVLAYCPSTNKFFVGVLIRSSLSGKFCWWHEGARSAMYSVTSKVSHWMPLDKPKEEET